jgi:hypothetical protein
MSVKLAFGWVYRFKICHSTSLSDPCKLISLRWRRFTRVSEGSAECGVVRSGFLTKTLKFASVSKLAFTSSFCAELCEVGFAPYASFEGFVEKIFFGSYIGVLIEADIYWIRTVPDYVEVGFVRNLKFGFEEMSHQTALRTAEPSALRKFAGNKGQNEKVTFCERL